MAINPLQAPINYAVEVQSPFEAALSGVKLGAGLEELEVARQKRAMEAQQQQAAQAQQAQFRSGLNAFFAKPAAERTFDELQPLLLGANKQQFDALKLIGEGMSTDKLNSSKRFTSQVLLAFEANPETAKTLLQDRINAETDPNQKRAFQDILTIANQDPNRASRLVESLGAGTFGEDWYKGITAVRNERRTAEREPSALRKSQADADAAVAEAQRKVLEAADTPTRLAAEQDLRVANAEKARIEAEVARATQPFKISEAQSQSIIKAAEAKFAPDKFGADLGLTQAQIEASRAARRASDAAAAKSGADAKRAQAEANQMAAGIIPVEKRPEAETKFRTEYNNQTKPFQEVKSAYGRVLASEDTAVGDLSLIFGYMKMLDPGSVVREGEFATAQNAAGVPERIQNIYNRVISGQRLSASQRDSFKGQANKLYQSAGEQETVVRQGLERIAKGYGLNTANIFYTPTETPPGGTQSPNAVTVNGKTYTRPANFTDAQWTAYKQSVGAK
jgi:hypothetical protein